MKTCGIILLSLLVVTQVAAEEWVLVKLGGVKLELRLADTQQKRSQGLMGVEHLEEQQGLLMEFKPSRKVGLWMKGMKMPIDAGFISEEGKLSWIVSMGLTGTSKTYSTDAKTAWVVEVNSGWFERNGVRVGDLLQFE